MISYSHLCLARSSQVPPLNLIVFQLQTIKFASASAGSSEHLIYLGVFLFFPLNHLVILEMLDTSMCVLGIHTS